MPDFRLNGCRIKVSPLRKKAERERETDAKNFVWSGNGERERAMEMGFCSECIVGRAV